MEQDETTVTGGATKQTLMNNNSDDSAIATWDDDDHSLDCILDKNANDSLYVLEFPFDGLDEEDDISESLSGKLEADCGDGSIFLDSLAWGLSYLALRCGGRLSRRRTWETLHLS